MSSGIDRDSHFSKRLNDLIFFTLSKNYVSCMMDSKLSEKMLLVKELIREKMNNENSFLPRPRNADHNNNQQLRNMYK